MKIRKFPQRLVTALIGASFATLAGAQQPAQPAAAPQASSAASLGLFVYPAKGQAAAQQSKDEGECYAWSKSESGFDPAAPAPAATPATAAAPEKHGGGERARGAVRGAAAGAVIGEVADNDASKGAEIGAAAGVLAGGRQARHAKQEQQKEAAAQAQASADAAKAAEQQKVDTFKRGMAACLEGRGYTVK